MFWREKSEAAQIDKYSEALFQFLADRLRKDGRIRAEDMISAASIAGELCIETAGNFNPRKHTFARGSRIFSDKVNELFSGDSSKLALEQLPAESIVGALRDKLLLSGYTQSDFPDLKSIFESFAANVGNRAEWGRVPLLVPEGNRPFAL